MKSTLKQHMRPALALAFAALIHTAPAAAETVRQDGRYALITVDGGFIRLDTQSGEIARCTGDPDRLTCRLAADERLAYVGEIERLENRVEQLEKRLSALETAQAAPPAGASRNYGLPSDEELDKVMSMTDTVFRRFFGLVRELKRDFEQDRL